MKIRIKPARVLIYLLGMVTLALGICLTTRAALGVSPIISVAFCFSTITGMNIGDATFLWYSTFVLLEILVHLTGLDRHGSKAGKAQKVLKDLLQLPLSLVFTRFMNLFTRFLPDFASLQGFWGSYAARIPVLLAAIVLTGIGISFSVNMRLIPNPGDGVVQALSDTIGKPMGLSKNIWDASCITLTIVFSLVAAGRLIGIGLGTVICVIGVGRVVALFNRLTLPAQLKAAGMNEPSAK